MMVERENAKNEQYIFQYNDNPFSEVITYKKHLINNTQIAITSWTPRGKNLGHGWSRRIYP